MNKIYKEAVALSEKVETLSAKRKLTADVFNRSMQEMANSDDARLDALKAKLESDPKGKYLRWTLAFYRQSVRWVKEPSCSGPPKEPWRLHWLGRHEEATQELQTIGSSILELFALAVRETAREHPEVFGDIEDMAAHQLALTEAKVAYAEALNRIENEYTTDDIIVGQPDKEGRARISYKVSRGKVAIGEGSGERLVNFLRSKGKVPAEEAPENLSAGRYGVRPVFRAT